MAYNRCVEKLRGLNVGYLSSDWTHGCNEVKEKPVIQLSCYHNFPFSKQLHTLKKTQGWQCWPDIFKSHTRLGCRDTCEAENR